MLTQVSSGELNANRNLMWTKRGKARLILIFSTNTNCENMAYQSFRSEKCSGRGLSLCLSHSLSLSLGPNGVSLGICWCCKHGSSDTKGENGRFNKTIIFQNHIVFVKSVNFGFVACPFSSSFGFLVFFCRIPVSVSIVVFDVNKFKIGKIQSL